MRLPEPCSLVIQETPQSQFREHHRPGRYQGGKCTASSWSCSCMAVPLREVASPYSTTFSNRPHVDHPFALCKSFGHTSSATDSNNPPDRYQHRHVQPRQRVGPAHRRGVVDRDVFDYLIDALARSRRSRAASSIETTRLCSRTLSALAGRCP